KLEKEKEELAKIQEEISRLKERLEKKKELEVKKLEKQVLEEKKKEIFEEKPQEVSFQKREEVKKRLQSELESSKTFTLPQEELHPPALSKIPSEIPSQPSEISSLEPSFKKPIKENFLPGIVVLASFLAVIGGLIFFFFKWQPESSTPSVLPALPEAKVSNLPLTPSVPTHKECRGEQCIVIEGEGVDLCESDDVCKPPLPPISFGVSEKIELSALNSDVFIALLDEKFKKEYPPETFIEIIPYYQGQLLTISQLFEGLDLHPPDEVKNNLETYNLYLYSQEELFVQERRNRLGIAFKIKDGKVGVVRTAMNDWEKVLPDDFLKVHTLWKRGAKASPEFLNCTDPRYKDVPIRYTNFPAPDLSIDWAITNNVLLLTTSRESMWRTIDLLR
ncbi:MAG TPA: hypothetical protein PLQ72_02765, partial [Candidatus Pacearchaeota archaeon]|nr:hypothetical protein [Candidatus Pacearchaeota archaeon]